jgi:4-amino-4-deoxyprephenate dehydrogenase
MDGTRFGRVVVAGGSGGVGQLFVRHLVGHCAELVVLDPATPPGQEPGCPAGLECPGRAAGGGPDAAAAAHYQGDISAPDPMAMELLGSAEVVLLAVPEEAALASAGLLAGLLRPDSLLADTLSVKGPWFDALAETGPRCEVLGLNPMFGPSVGFAGRPVAAVRLRGGPHGQRMARLVGEWGGRVIWLGDGTKHDRLSAACQALVHAAVIAFGTALRTSEADLADLLAMAPPPFTTLLALLARLCANPREVYWDIQRANPRAPAAREGLASAVRQLAAAVDGADQAEFVRLLDECATFLGPHLDPLADHCARIFAARADGSASVPGRVLPPDQKGTAVNPRRTTDHGRARGERDEP